MYNHLDNIATDLLGRTLRVNDGLSAAVIAAAEDQLGIALPTPLKAFYTLVGNLPLFMNAFQQMYSPAKLLLQKNKLVFMGENQGVCYWAVAIEDNNMPVYQSADIDEEEWWEEEVGLEAFLALTLYYQYLQANCHRQQIISLAHLNSPEEKEHFLAAHNKDLTKVMEHNGLVIYNHPQRLLWYFSDETGGLPDEINELLK